MNATILAAVGALAGLSGLALSVVALLGSRHAIRSAGPASFRRAEADARELIAEIHGTAEKLNVWLARVAKREQREARQALEASTSHDQAADGSSVLPMPVTVAGGLPGAPPAEDPSSRAAWKAQMRAALSSRRA